MSDDPLGKPPGLDQRLDVKARSDTHLLAEQREFFGGDVARRARLAGKRAAAEARHRGIERRNPEPQTLIGAGDALPARVVEMKGDPHVIPAVPNGADRVRDAPRRGPAHGVGERDVLHHHAGLARDGECIRNRLDDFWRQNCNRRRP